MADGPRVSTLRRRQTEGLVFVRAPRFGFTRQLLAEGNSTVGAELVVVAKIDHVS